MQQTTRVTKHYLSRSMVYNEKLPDRLKEWCSCAHLCRVCLYCSIAGVPVLLLMLERHPARLPVRLYVYNQSDKDPSS